MITKESIVQGVKNKIMKRKEIIRDNFRNSVFTRDEYKCRVCSGTSDLDAHHIHSREVMPAGGYVATNGISICEYCHIKAEEEYWDPGAFPELSVANLYKIIGSSEEMARKDSERLI